MTRPSETFEDYLERSTAYFDAVRSAGDLPWFENTERRAEVAERLGLPADTPADELRRALWEARHRRTDPSRP